ARRDEALTMKTTAMTPTVLAAVCLVLSACGKPAAVAESKGDAGKAPPAVAAANSRADEKPTEKSDEKSDEKSGDKDKEGVTLTPEQLEKLGVTTQPARSFEYREESTGYGVVLDHQAIAQAVADLQTAEAAAQFSKASLERARQLHGTQGAISTDLEQTAEQKAAVDSAALTLTTEKLSSTWGMKPPWKDVHDPRVRSLAHGDTQLVKVTFPLGTLQETPAELQGARIGSGRTDATSDLRPVWIAPADVNIPGRSFFTLLPAGTVAEGERLQVWAPTGRPTSGAVVPMAAIVLSNSKYWCYVERTPGTLVRAEVDTSHPTDGGYFVTEEVKAGDKIAITAAAQLLAKEKGSSEEPD
ncbi:MAG TPA: hypothetical protein VGC34_00825, partial [Steroidobacteraceae bacterium]